MWLLTQQPWLTCALVLLLSVSLWVWRQAVFPGPAREYQPPSRRTVLEYIEAMARLLQRARNSARFLLEEFRDGTLWKLRCELGLPPGSWHLSF